jgi:hypothetical protein
MFTKACKLIRFSLPLLVAGCAQVQVAPSNMAIEYQFLDSSDEIYEACGTRAEACARIVGNNCVITLPKTHWDQHLVHEMRHCFGEVHAPSVALSNW